ncbi:protein DETOXIFICATION 44, chloroplastic [Magnolia sinica]|uniref:protein DETOXIFICATION 44, chloroplastic n=1 Tax=Magnolia sinica TaxID=86752 RepID=UPI0026587969|nr:protein DETOXIFICATION 44, chloroplastic [Magnolia sinica]XP_058110404.1 protein DETOXIFICATION 44, chloroplastic [Magnolia sinica]XP_058110405.1 protein DETOXIFICATION 44, chloroplastic [Magnolia sinica]
MASTNLSHPLLCFYSLHQNQICFCHPNAPKLSLLRKINSHCTTRFLSIRSKSSPQTNPTPKEKNPISESNPGIRTEKPKNSDAIFGSWLVTALSRFLRRIRNELKDDKLGLEILSIALPALLALAADPIASLVDSAFVGHLGSVELAAVGVSISVFNLVSKLFNVPLLNITTSFVAEEQALVADGKNTSLGMGTGDNSWGSASVLQSVGDKERKKLLPAVSTSLALAAGIGIAEAIALFIGSGSLMNIMGIPVDSPMRVPAEQFLSLRAFGAPPIVIALAAQGSFRGFMDTKTPFYAVGAGNLLNVILDPILIFLFGLGVSGAAISTVLSEYVIAFILLWKLNEKVTLIPTNIAGEGVLRYLKSGSLLIARTIAVLLTMTLGTSMAAQQGPIPMAGHQICLQVWLAISLLTDALALAGQALLASVYTKGNYKEARRVIYRVLQIGAVTGVALAVLLFLGFGAFSSLFSTDPAVLEIACSGLLFVAGSQPMNALAFVFDGLYYGVSDFAFAAYSMVLAGLISSVFLVVAAPVFGLAGVWTGLFLFMTLRVVAGFWRLGAKDGPWKVVWSEVETGMAEK